MEPTAIPDAPARPALKRRPRPALSAAEGRALARADIRYKKAQRALAAAETQRKALLEKARVKVPLDEWVIAGGWAIKIRMQSPGERFSLAKYLQAGYKLTAAMRKFVTEGDESPRLTVVPDSEIPGGLGGEPTGAKAS